MARRSLRAECGPSRSIRAAAKSCAYVITRTVPARALPRRTPHPEAARRSVTVRCLLRPSAAHAPTTGFARAALAMPTGTCAYRERTRRKGGCRRCPGRARPRRELADADVETPRQRTTVEEADAERRREIEHRRCRQRRTVRSTRGGWDSDRARIVALSPMSVRESRRRHAGRATVMRRLRAVAITSRSHRLAARVDRRRQNEHRRLDARASAMPSTEVTAAGKARRSARARPGCRCARDDAPPAEHAPVVRIDEVEISLVKPPPRRFSISTRPTEPARLVAPTTATDVGTSNGRR